MGDCALLLAFSIIAFCFGDLSYLGFFNLIESGSSFGSGSFFSSSFNVNYF